MTAQKPNLICEVDSWFKASREEIEENRSKNDGKIVMETCLQRANRKNQMGRVYPIDLLQREFSSYQRYVEERSAHGELDHPDSAVVSLSNVSHIVTKQWWKNDEHGNPEWWGDIELLNTPSGKVAQALVEDGVKIGVSSRGVGTTQRHTTEDAEVVQNNFIIICFDLVSHPSTHSAIPTLKEGIDISTMPMDIQKRYIENQIRMFVNIDLKNRF